MEERVTLIDATTAHKFSQFTQSLFDLSILITNMEEEYRTKLKGLDNLVS